MNNVQREIKAWLKKIDKDRYWLAEVLLVNKKTIDNWLSSTPGIPQSKLDRIKNLMAEGFLENSVHREVIIPQIDIVLKISPEEYAKFVSYADAQNMSVQEWILYALSYLGEHKELIYNSLNISDNGQGNLEAQSTVPVRHVPGIPDMDVWSKSVNDMTAEEFDRALEGPYRIARRERGETPGVLYGKKKDDAENEAG